MCKSCWVDQGSPTDLPENYEEILHLIDILYEDHASGGPLHVELDDYNLESNFDWTLYFYNYVDQDNVACLGYVCQRIQDLMNALPVQQRYAVMAYRDEYFTKPAEPR